MWITGGRGSCTDMALPNALPFPAASFLLIRPSSLCPTSLCYSLLPQKVRFPSQIISLAPNSSFSSLKQYSGDTEYQFPDPIPEFADAETEKFRAHLLNRLAKKDIFGDSLEQVVGICTEIFDSFLHADYGGPGTLLVVPFIDMADTINEMGLPGGPQAARAAVVWAQKHVDEDWKGWTGAEENGE